MANNNGRAANRKTKTKKFSPVLAIFLCLIFLIIGFVAGFAVNHFLNKPESDKITTIYSGELQIHFLELGVYNTGDCVYIKAGDTDMLIDAGAKESSVGTIEKYVDQYCTDGILEYVIVTHAHEDHYAGFASSNFENTLFARYETRTIIDFALTNQSETSSSGKTSMYGNYLKNREQEVADGATHYNALQCYNETDGAKKSYKLSDDVEFEILYNYYYDHTQTSGENDYSVCLLLKQGDRNYLFTGDLEEKGENKLVENNKLPEVELYKAGHHGSKTSSGNKLLAAIKPKRVAVCCCCGNLEYTKIDANTFPTQEFVDRIAPYTKEIYVTTIVVDENDKTFKSMNGNIVFHCGAEITVKCSENNTFLCDTEWFKAHRTMPAAWAS